jgi:hypothetical protein
MLCPQCQTEMVINHSQTCVEGDQSPDTRTRVYVEHSLQCVCASCANYKKVVTKNRVELI